MTPFHAGFVRQLRSTTALQSSAAWLVSENVRAARMMNEIDEHGRVVNQFYRAPSPTLQQEIAGAILLSEVKPIIERMN